MERCIILYSTTISLIYIPYSRKFSWDNIFANVVKVAISAMQSLTQEKKFADKIFGNKSKLAEILSW